MANKFHVFIMLILHVLQSALPHKLSSLTHTVADECSLLFQFKETMSINNYSSSDPLAYPKVASWSLNRSDGAANCCLWDGVECRFGHVIGLDLSSSFLYGPIDSNNSLFKLTHLHTLNLADNNFRSSRIPSAIGRLSQLAKLNLSYSGFGGEVPEQISHLRNLVSLSLTGYQLTLQSYDFRNLVQNSSETLRELFLSGVNIDSEVPDILVNCSLLTSLVMGDCGLRGQFPTDIFKLPTLQLLDVQSNHDLTGCIPEFHGSSELKNLNLASTNFQGSIPSTIGNLSHLTQLTHLVLSSNKFTGSLPPSIGNLTQLTYLDLSYNEMIGQIPSSFSNLVQLTYLDISRNKLSGEIPSSFFNLTKVEELYLSGNQFKGELPNSLLNLQNLEVFSLHDGNNVTVDFYLFLSLKKLKYLVLTGNNITFPVIDSYSNQTQPKFVDLYLDSCNLKVFPEFLKFQHQLECLNLENNSIGGLIPGWMLEISKETLSELYLSHNLLMGFEQRSLVAHWVSLNTLDLSHNMLQGSIPVLPPTMMYFSLSNNKLTGGIPLSLCDLLSLELLDLSYNNITGSIPLCLEKLSNSLVVLKLGSNILQGTIPNIFTNESKLQMIDLSKNKLEGQVPRSLENCESLQLLDLGYNVLDDMFPFWLGALSKLQVLILSSNKFHGIIRIPSKMKVNFPKLHIIDISNNSFSGDLPHQYFQEWLAMKETKANTTYMETDIQITADHMVKGYSFSIQLTNKGVKLVYLEIMNTLSAIDLSSNMFRGNISESIKTLSGLHLLNLSNNQLSGFIPSSMGNLINLEALDLSSNKLSGMIPPDLLKLNFLGFLNVSNNNLIGPIPEGRQFDTFSNTSYMGNQALCGYPLSMRCGDSEASKPPKVSYEEDTESDFPNEIDWIVILIGVLSGLVIGLVYGDITSGFSKNSENKDVY